MKYTILLVFALICLTQANRYFYKGNKQVGEPYPGQTTHWFDEQILDHFIPVPVQYWSQQYFVVDTYFDKKQGPLILYIGGEGASSGISTSSDLPALIAEKYNGIVVTLEHRFYGESQPFGQTDDSYSLENLKYLTQEQALADLANFIGWLKKNNAFGILEDTPVITIGGSYPGALSAWFRYLYKSSTIGALASSAVVNAIEDYQEFDTQIRLSTTDTGDVCPDTIRALTAYAEDQLFNQDSQTAQEFKESFGAGQLDDLDFLYFFADIFALQVQYGGTTTLCDKQLQGTLEDQLAAIQQHAKTSLNPNDYDQEQLKDTSYGKYKNIRQWTYQTCTYFGWFYTASIYEPMRSKLIDLQYFRNLCQNVYGEEYIPDIPMTNLMMGGVDMSVTNIIFTNGVQDPWKWASILKDKPPMLAYVADCMDCAHCVDLHSPYQGEPEQLTQIREDIFEQMGLWIGQYWDEQAQNSRVEL